MTDLPGGRVLVLGGEPRMLLAMVRSLGRKGLGVDVGWCSGGGPALRSRYITRIVDLPSPSLDRGDWIERLQAHLRRERYDVVMPGPESAVVPLQLNRSAFADFPEVVLLPERAFAVVSDKAKTNALAVSLGIPMPRTLALRRDEAWLEKLADVPLPAIVKPGATIRDDDVAEKGFAYPVETEAELREYLAHLFETGAEALVQEIVPGDGVGVEVIAHEGRILSALQHHRLHETVGYGSTLRETVPLARHLLEATEALMGALDYSGVAMVEFRDDETTGTWSLIEINGRFWGSLPLAVGAGADFPWYLYRLRVHGDTRPPTRYTPGIRSRSLTDDVRWTRRALGRVQPTFPPRYDDELGWRVNSRPRSAILTDIVRAALHLDTVDTWAPDDPAPHRQELLDMARTAWGWARERLGRRGS